MAELVSLERVYARRLARTIELCTRGMASRERAKCDNQKATRHLTEREPPCALDYCCCPALVRDRRRADQTRTDIGRWENAHDRAAHLRAGPILGWLLRC
jgi:hypothetical protein